MAVATPGGGGEHDNDDIFTQEREPEAESETENSAKSSTAHPPTNLSTPTPTPTPQMQPSNPIPPSTANLIIDQIRKILEENLTVVETKVDKNTTAIEVVVARVDNIEENMEKINVSTSHAINTLDMKVDQYLTDNSTNMERLRSCVNECVEETNKVKQYVEVRLNRNDSDIEEMIKRND